VGASVRSATLHAIVDNESVVYLNGSEVGTANGGWSNPNYPKINLALTPGTTNTLTINATNAGGPAGLIAAVIAGGRTLVRTDMTWTWKPTCAQASSVLVGGSYTAQCVPNLADIASRNGFLSAEATAVGRVARRTDSDVMLSNQPLLPGEQLISVNRQYVAVLHGDCNLVVYQAGPPRSPVWASGTRMPGNATPGSLTVGVDDGVLRLADTTGAVYWQSGKVSAQMGAPFRLVLTNTGELQVQGPAGAAAPVWSSKSGPNSKGFPSMRTCEQAAAAYKVLRATSMAAPQHAGMSPWQHFMAVGKLQGWDWPGPSC
jgi:hypothetical protein